jgi:hypothetical protein
LLENALISTLLIPANSCNSLALASSHLLATALCTLIVHSSSLIVAHPIKHRAFIDAKAGEHLALARPHAHARERLAFIVALLARALHSSFLSSLLTLARFVGSSHLS